MEYKVNNIADFSKLKLGIWHNFNNTINPEVFHEVWNACIEYNPIVTLSHDGYSFSIGPLINKSRVKIILDDFDLTPGEKSTITKRIMKLLT